MKPENGLSFNGRKNKKDENIGKEEGDKKGAGRNTSSGQSGTQHCVLSGIYRGNWLQGPIFLVFRENRQPSQFEVI